MRYDDLLSLKKHRKIIRELALGFLEGSTDPRCLMLQKLVLEDDYAGILAFEVQYSQPDNIEVIRVLRHVLALFSKDETLPIKTDKEYVAFETFLEYERACKQWNERYLSTASDENIYSSDVECIIFYTRRKIAEILGPRPSLQELQCAFGPGSTTSVRKRDANARRKLSAPWGYTKSLSPLIPGILKMFPLIGLANGNRELRSDIGQLRFVPKNAKTFRSVTIPPTLNGFIQKGVGSYLKNRAQMAGLRLRDQTQNQSLARRGSADGSVATLDFKGFSDTISCCCVFDLLPTEWVDFLWCIRNGIVEYDNPWSGERETFHLEKFSCMGDAFTFELQSIILYALAVSTCRFLDVDSRSVSVFGDDTILPVETVQLFATVTRELGFFLHPDKSYWSGPFRESCGSDWYLGEDVRPVYIKEQLSPRLLFTIHNELMRKFEFRMARMVLGYIPEHLRLFGPDGYGDGHLIGDWDPYTKRKYVHRGYDGSFFDTFVALGKQYKKRLPGDWIYPCYSMYARPETECEDRVGPDRRNGPDPHGFTHSVMPEEIGKSNDAWYRIPGTCGYKRMSIYTLKRSIFAS